MRIADKTQYNQITHNVQKNRVDMAQLQDQAATQKKVTKPSDDPLAAARVLSSRTEVRGNDQFLRNIQTAKSFLEFSDQSLGELTEILMRAKELALSQAGDSGANSQTRLMTAAEMEQLHNQAIQIGNRKLGERFVFGGYNTQIQPFNQEGDYRGDDGEIKVYTNKVSNITINIPGNRVFLGEGLGGDGTIRPSRELPQTIEELKQQQQFEMEREEHNRLQDEESFPIRRMASIGPKENQLQGINIFETIGGITVALRTDDKAQIQQSLDDLDRAISQVVFARSELGSRVMSVNSTIESIQKATLDQKTLASQLEDADVFQVMSDINKTDSTLRATLETSGKLVQSSLLDFLK